MNRLKTEFDGLILKNPLMPASGPLTGDFEKMEFIQEQGVGAPQRYRAHAYTGIGII